MDRDRGLSLFHERLKVAGFLAVFVLSESSRVESRRVPWSIVDPRVRSVLAAGDNSSEHETSK